MGLQESVRRVAEQPLLDEETKAELRGIARDENEIRERFYAELEFGTAGLRGIIGAGTNRMKRIYRKKSNPGTGKLHCQSERTVKRRGHRLRFPSYVPGVCGCGSALPGSQRHQSLCV